jgi:hypothetical protein
VWKIVLDSTCNERIMIFIDTQSTAPRDQGLENKMKAFQDTSIFQGVKEFKAADGNTYRATRRFDNDNYWDFAELHGDVFIHCGICRPAGRATPRSIFAAYIKAGE